MHSDGMKNDLKTRTSERNIRRFLSINPQSPVPGDKEHEISPSHRRTNLFQKKKTK